METVSTSRATRVLRRWPTAAGVALAVLTVFDLSSGAALAPVLAASALSR
jgi:hypothetical protein